jgi:hypothetical protein
MYWYCRSNGADEAVAAAIEPPTIIRFFASVIKNDCPRQLSGPPELLPLDDVPDDDPPPPLLEALPPDDVAPPLLVPPPLPLAPPPLPLVPLLLAPELLVLLCRPSPPLPLPELQLGTIASARIPAATPLQLRMPREYQPDEPDGVGCRGRRALELQLK